MKTSLKISLSCIMLIFCLNIYTINAQILHDTTTFRQIEKCVDDIYGFRFADAKETCILINVKYPGHPAVYLLKGMIDYWENYPLLPNSPSVSSYIYEMHKCINLSEKKNKTSDKAESLLINLCAKGMLLLFYSENDFSSEVFSLATSTYLGIRQSYEYSSVYYDFNFFTGLYDYYREAYPEAYPVYKAVAFLFPKGNMEKGLIELNKAGKYSVVLKAESYSFLLWINTNYEHNYELATYYSKLLYDLYPENVQYLGAYVKSLLLIKHYDEAEKLIESSDAKDKNLYYQAQLSIFKGVLQEKKYSNDKLAEQLYIKGIKSISTFGHYSYEFAAYGYFGLSRISERKGDSDFKKTYREKAIKLADFKDVNFD